MSRREREQREAWLDANPGLRSAWDNFKMQLETAAGFARQGGRPDFEALTESAHAVIVAAGIEQDKD